MIDEFHNAVLADRIWPVWAGDLSSLGGEWPPAESLVSPSVERIENAAVVRFSRFPTAATWKSLATILSEAVADRRVEAVVVVVDTVATQMHGLERLRTRIRALSWQKRIVAHVEQAMGGGLLLTKAFREKFGEPTCVIGRGDVGAPFDSQPLEHNP